MLLELAVRRPLGFLILPQMVVAGFADCGLGSQGRGGGWCWHPGSIRGAVLWGSLVRDRSSSPKESQEA